MAAARKPFKLRKLEPHTAAKHALLRKYMGAWFPIMAKYNCPDPGWLVHVE